MIGRSGKAAPSARLWLIWSVIARSISCRIARPIAWRPGSPPIQGSMSWRGIAVAGTRMALHVVRLQRHRLRIAGIYSSVRPVRARTSLEETGKARRSCISGTTTICPSVGVTPIPHGEWRNSTAPKGATGHQSLECSGPNGVPPRPQRAYGPLAQSPWSGTRTCV
jgi:hypothetical protein